jgi:hypothetical protein
MRRQRPRQTRNYKDSKLKVVQDAFDGLVAEGEFVPLGLNEHGRMVYRNSR